MKFEVWGQYTHWYHIQIFFKNEGKMFFPIILKVPTTVCLRWCIYIGYSCASQEKEQEDCAAFFFLEMTKTTSKQTFFTVQKCSYSSILWCRSGQTSACRASTNCPSLSSVYDTSRFLWLIGITGKIPQTNTCSQYLISRKLKSNKQRTQ